MNIKDKKYGILTPSAKEALDSVITEYRDQVLEESCLRAVSSPSGEKEISVRDVLESVDKINQRQRRSRAKRLEAILQIYSLLGVMVTLIGIAFFFYGKTGFNLSSREQLSIALIISGTFFGILPFLLQRVRGVSDAFSRPPEESRIDSSVVFINKWNTIENELRRRAELSGKSTARQPLSSVIHILYTSGILSDEESDSLIFLLNLRNQIVHESLSIDRDHLEKAMNEADRILSMLKTR